MTGRNELENLQKKYSFIGLSDAQWSDVYKLWQENKNDSKYKDFYHALIEYLKKHANFSIIKKYYYHLAINPEHTPSRIMPQLATFFNFLDKIEYSITLEDATVFNNEPAIAKLLDKKIGGNTSIYDVDLERFVLENENLRTLCNVYLESKNIEVITTQEQPGGGVTSTKSYTSSELNEIYRKIEQGDSFAKEKLLIDNLGLVRSVSAKFLNKGMEFDDLYQEGCFGLIKAIELYDYRKGFAFSTYAIWWIRQAISRALKKQGRLIRLPDYQIDNINKLNRVKQEIERDLGYNPDDEELAEKSGLTLEQINELEKYNQEIVSLNVPIGDAEDDRKMDELIPDMKKQVADQVVEKQISIEFKNIMKNILTEAEYQIVSRHFGLFGQSFMSYEKIAEMLGISRQTVRTLEGRALIALRRNSKLNEMFNEKYKNKIILEEKNDQKCEFMNLENTALFNLKLLDSRMDLEAFSFLLELFPDDIIDKYLKYRNIDLENKKIYRTLKRVYATDFLEQMKIFESLLSRTFKQYKKLMLSNNYQETEILEKLNYYLTNSSLYFKFKRFSFCEMAEAIKLLEEDEQKFIFSKYGNDLIQYNEDIELTISEEKIYTKLDKILNKNVESSMKKYEEKQNLTKIKAGLEEYKLDQYSKKLYESYCCIYGKLISSEDLINIILNAISSYSKLEGISLEMSVKFKIEAAILLNLANKYRENRDSEESLEILVFVEEIIGNRIKQRYTNISGNVPYCFVSDAQISKVIEDTLNCYTGRLPFYVEASARIKKLSR